jgi:hypothetical protein
MNGGFEGSSQPGVADPRYMSIESGFMPRMRRKDRTR